MAAPAGLSAVGNVSGVLRLTSITTVLIQGQDEFIADIRRSLSHGDYVDNDKGINL